ncbi:hypothetical protein AZI86_11185 [Bdellovibrio bacteriovorus]|uniref:Uncharacterized protein n=1 Tax=Bdellovibrio bacteriovorus TaxID=959 RepID=A0A150WM67_BDEBC|nr:hypothetical protein [Bdellovibrio bacteriovorus]KYG64996.1 hypothetical protein AZI86_11185 [Bdellovibrio bacteriovorus]
MKSLHDDKYLIRDSLFNLVELSLLARMYEEHCTPSAAAGKLSPDSLAQTLLKMKATEKNGQLRVAIYDAEPVGFYWQYQGQVLAKWVQPEHRLEGIEQSLSGNH